MMYSTPPPPLLPPSSPFSPGTASEERRHFKDRFPLVIIAVLAVIQMLCTFTIVALEIGHNLLHFTLTNLLVGFWTSIPFTILWISMFATVCCCRRRSCATHAVIQNVFALIFALILIVVNILFIRHPNKCFFSEGLCHQFSWINSLADSIECLVDGRSNDCGNTRITLIVWQLIAGVLLALTCIIYLIIYSRIVLRKSQLKPYPILTATNSFVRPIFSSKNKQSTAGYPLTVSHHHHSYTISSHPFPNSTPVLIPVAPPQLPMLPSTENFYVNYIDSNPYATIRTRRANERF